MSTRAKSEAKLSTLVLVPPPLRIYFPLVVRIHTGSGMRILRGKGHPCPVLHGGSCEYYDDMQEVGALKSSD